MKKTLLLTVMTALAFQVSASSEFPEWKLNPQADLDEGLIAGVSCVESMGDITLDMDVSTMEARASLAASLEAMVQKELERSSDSNTKKIKTADRKEKVVTTSITAKVYIQTVNESVDEIHVGIRVCIG